MEKSIHILNREETRKKLQIYLIDPLLNHVLERVFPYIILICILFAFLLIVAMMTFGILILQNRPILWSASSALGMQVPASSALGMQIPAAAIPVSSIST